MPKNSMPWRARSSSGITSASSGIICGRVLDRLVAGTGSPGRARATPPSGTSSEIQLCGSRGPHSTRWPGSKGPIQSPTKALPEVAVIRCSSYSSWKCQRASGVGKPCCEAAHQAGCLRALRSRATGERAKSCSSSGWRWRGRRGDGVCATGHASGRSAHDITAIDVQCLRGDVRSLVAGQEDRGAGDVFGGAHAAQRHGLADRRFFSPGCSPS